MNLYYYYYYFAKGEIINKVLSRSIIWTIEFLSKSIYSFDISKQISVECKGNKMKQKNDDKKERVQKKRNKSAKLKFLSSFAVFFLFKTMW